MTRTNEEIFHAMLQGALRLQDGDQSQIETLAGLYAQTTSVREPMSPFGETPMTSRTALREHFAAAGSAGTGGLKVEDVRMHQSTDPEVFIGEFTYRSKDDHTAHNIVVVRVRDGQIVESRDYIDYLGIARAANTLDTLCDLLSTSQG